MGAVNTTYTFTATDTITSTKMNNIIDQTTVTDEAIIGTTLEVASGKLKVRSQGITSNEIAAGEVKTGSIADGAVTPAKFSTGGPEWTPTSTNINIKQPILELGTGITTNSSSFIDFHSVHPLTDYECRLLRDQGANGWFAIQNTGSGAISLQSTGGVYFASANMPNPVGNAPIFGVRAWVNFNGNVGSVAIREGGNVSGVVRNQLGRYTITFTTPMQDANYAIVAWARDANATDNNYFVSAASNATKLAGSFQIEVNSPGGTVDSPEINVMIIR